MRNPEYIEGFVDALKFVVKSFEEVKVNSQQVVSETVSHGEGSNALQNNQHETPSADTNEDKIKSELYEGLECIEPQLSAPEKVQSVPNGENHES